MSKKISRRNFIKASAIGLAAAGAVAAAGKKIMSPFHTEQPDPYPVMPEKKPPVSQRKSRPVFFDDHQYAMVATLAAIIVPTDEEPGATEAGVVDYIDNLVAKSGKKQKKYTKGLSLIDELSYMEYGHGFLDLKIKEQIELLISMDETESKRERFVSNFIERVDRKIDNVWDDLFGIGDTSLFFKKLREDVFYGFYSNPVSWKIAGYFGPPQPNGYPDYAQPSSSENYTDIVREISNRTCLNCHFDLLEKEDHMDKTDCMGCHELHSPFQEDL